jgi:hypothetical protein
MGAFSWPRLVKVELTRFFPARLAPAVSTIRHIS